MKRAYILLNHTLTPNQVQELKESYKVEEIIYPDKNLADCWAQIAPQKELDYKVLDTIKAWLKEASAGDVLLVQGEFGHTFYIVDYALKKGLVPLHAVTKRVESETVEGEKVTRKYIFTHCCFRKYLYS